jgi:hypothetical protein
MDHVLRSRVYSFIDNNGIPCSHYRVINININTDQGTSGYEASPTKLLPDLSQFSLTKEETEELIINYVYQTTQIRIGSVNDLLKMRSLHGKPFFLLLNEHDRSNIKYCLAFKRIPGSVIFRDADGIETLGNIEEIDGDLGFSDSAIKDLGKLRRVSGNIWIAQTGKGMFTKLKSLQMLEHVGGNLNIKNSPIENLGDLKYVGGNLNLRETFVESLGKVELIGGNLLLPEELRGIIDLSKSRIVGKVKYFNDRNIQGIL